MILNVKVVDPVMATLLESGVAKLPERGSEQAAGLDLRLSSLVPVIITPGQMKIVGTGIATEPRANEPAVVGLVFVRSSTGIKLRISLANGTGVIDQDYRGEIRLALVNDGDGPVVIQPGDRICQLVYVPAILPIVQRVEEFSAETERGTGGIGSTGTK